MSILTVPGGIDEVYLSTYNSSEVELLCDHGPNKGKPGVCPDSGSEPETTKKPSSTLPDLSRFHSTGESITDPECCLYNPDPNSIEPSTGVTRSSRVGVPGMESPPPPRVPRLPNLTPKERAAESRFANAYEKNADDMANEYRDRMKSGEIGDAPNIFNTDDAKMLSPDYNPQGVDDATSKAAKATMNLVVHQTANAIAKRAFTQHLDELSKLSDGDPKKSVLVTSGGVAAGKGYALANSEGTSELSNKVGAVWDAAGEQNATENPWVLKECQKRGIKATFAFVHADSKETWENEKRGVVERAGKKGRMVDARVFADSYAIGAKNFEAFAKKFGDQADIVYLDNRGKPQATSTMPEGSTSLNADEIYSRSLGVLLERSSKLSPAVLRGGSLGQRVWKS